MIKRSIYLILTLWASIAASHTERYYNLHPRVLQQVIAGCPNKQPRDLNCDQLRLVASRVNELAYQLRLNPQNYGKEILALQQQIAKQAQHQPTVDQKHEIEERLAIVKWLESPEG